MLANAALGCFGIPFSFPIPHFKSPFVTDLGEKFLRPENGKARAQKYMEFPAIPAT